jgi:ribonuclease III
MAVPPSSSTPAAAPRPNAAGRRAPAARRSPAPGSAERAQAAAVPQGRAAVADTLRPDASQAWLGKPALVALQQRLGHRFRRIELLEHALTHRSFSADHNERLEFLGDSVLNAAVADRVYRLLPRVPEGDLSRIRAHLVRQESLHRLAVGVDLSPHLRLGEGELRSGGAQRASILANALEAILGAVYLDAGFDAASALVQRLLADVALDPTQSSLAKDPKTALQEWLQGRRLPVPSYRVVATLGAAHRQTFDVECAVPERGLVERGLGGSRRAAEQAAAAAMLERLRPTS